MHTRTWFFVLFALVALSTLLSPVAPAAQATSASDTLVPDRALLQFTVGGQVLGFQPTGLYLAGGRQLLRVEFAGTAGVQPTAPTSPVTDGHAQPLAPVTYANLWNGITLTFQPVAGGIFKSTYLLAPAAQVADIHLRYNVPVQVDPSGNLTLQMPTGEFQESAPIAWQDIDGARLPVQVAFQSLAEREIGFRLGAYNPSYPLVIDPTLQWNTFLGSAGDDGAGAIAVDANGNVYVIGYSNATWGAPIRPFNAGNYDAFVAKLNSSGMVLWNTFLGGTNRDMGRGIALDSSGNIYAIGNSEGTWGQAPRRPYTASSDVFVAKLDSSGTLVWNSFLGGGSIDEGSGITLDGSGNIYTAGASNGDWGTQPPRPYTGGRDGFVAKLGSDGTLLWNSFLGGASYDSGSGIAVDGDGNAYIIGSSNAGWGSPLRGFSDGALDAYVAKLNSGGVLQWNTFLGSAAADDGIAIALDASGGLYTTGTSDYTWGNSPRRAYSAGSDIFVAKLDGSGALQWNTFLGGSSYDAALALSLDPNGNPYISGNSAGTWGSPFRAYTASMDAVVSKVDSDGTLLWNTFLGGASGDEGTGIAVDGSGNAYVIGFSYTGWGSPLESFHGTTSFDAFVAMIRKENSTTTLTAHTPNPSFTGQTVTISYTVAANPPINLTPTGYVTVSDGTISCTDTVAVGHCSLAFATVGTKNLTASYAGDTDFSGSASAAVEHQVNKGNTTTSITGHTPTSSTVRQTYTVTWTVSVTPPAAGTPTGTVTVNDGSGGTCAAAVAAGQCEIISTSAGTKMLTAAFGGDDNFVGSTSVAQAHQVNKVNTTTSITGHAPNPSIVGQAYTVTWTVSVTPPAAGTPTGTVTVDDGSGRICTADVAVGQCEIVSTSAGTKNLTATFAGDTDFSDSASAATGHLVNKGNTTTSITGHAPNPSMTGQAYTVSWTVNVTAPGAGTLTGTVTVSDGGAGSCTAAVAEGHCTLASNSPGSKVLTATFSGDSNFQGSSGTAAHEVKTNEYRMYLPLLRR